LRTIFLNSFLRPGSGSGFTKFAGFGFNESRSATLVSRDSPVVCEVQELEGLAEVNGPIVQVRQVVVVQPQELQVPLA